MSSSEVKLTRRSLLEIAGSLGGFAALQGIGTVVGSTMRPALAQARGELSSLRSTSKSWLWGAEDFGLGIGSFEKSGVKVAMAATERGVNQDALISGAADVLLGATTQNMRVQIRGQPVIMIAGMVNKYASNVVVKKEFAEKAGVTEASDPKAKARVLKGLRLGTTGPGAAPDQLLRYFMGQVGIDPDRDAKLVRVGGPAAMIAAVEQNQIDGFCLSSPTSDVAVRRSGCVYLFNMATNPPPDLADYLYITASVTRKTAQDKADQITAYCRGIALALKQIHEQPDTFKAWAKTWFADVPADLFDISVANNLPIYMKTPVPTEKQYQANVVFLTEELKALGQPGIPSNFGFAQAFDLRYVEKAMASL